MSSADQAGGRRPQGGGRHSHNIGTAYRWLGEMQKALEKYNEALPIFRAIGDRRRGYYAQQHRRGL